MARGIRVGDVRVDGDAVVWSESRPKESGRTALVRREAEGSHTELVEQGHNARTAVHEYGGGSWWVAQGIVWYANWADQRLYRRDPGSTRAEPISPPPEQPRGDRYADGVLTPDGNWIVCVREHHPPGGAVKDIRNEIVRLNAHAVSDPEVLVTGPDFVSSPRLSRDGSQICWLEWDHPHMPWDETRLCVRDLRTGEQTTIAGGPGESVGEPVWQADGLTFISDRRGWWNLYRWSQEASEIESIVEIDAEIGMPHWAFGSSRYAVLDDGRIVFARIREGIDGLGLRTVDGEISDLELPFTYVRCVRAAGGATAAVVAAGPTEESGISLIEVGERAALRSKHHLRVTRGLEEADIAREYISSPEPVRFPSAGGRTAHAILYRPTSGEYRAPAGELPPMLVEVHGGPTAAAYPQLDLDIQYWTSRGFLFLDLNYGGSTGYGRAYRELLRGNWGVVDVEDAIAAAFWAGEEGHADPRRICIRGGSAGGFTTLAALTREDTPFAAGGDWFGVADLELFRDDTHKFECCYLNSLVGPYPERREVYRARSPIEHVDAFSRPLIVFQGLEDAIVPPNQAEIIVEALRAKGVPVVYLAFEGEQHGFRRAENIRRALDSELSFYAQVLGFELPADEEIEPVAIT